VVIIQEKKKMKMEIKKPKLYDFDCEKCGIKTPHRIFLMSRNKGFKLECLICFCQTNWLNVKRLNEGVGDEI